MEARTAERRTRGLAIGVVCTALAVGAMAIDHLVGDDPGLEDPLTFGLSVTLCVVASVLVFGRVVPRATDEGMSRATLVCTVLALLSLPLLWLGLAFVLGGGALALGLQGTGRRATIAIAIGALVLALATGAYAYEAGRKLL